MNLNSFEFHVICYQPKKCNERNHIQQTISFCMHTKPCSANLSAGTYAWITRERLKAKLTISFLVQCPLVFVYITYQDLFCITTTKNGVEKHCNSLAIASTQG